MLLSSSNALLDLVIKYCEIYGLLFCFVMLLKCLIGMLFIGILLLFLYEVDSHESTCQFYGALMSLHCRLLSLDNLAGT